MKPIQEVIDEATAKGKKLLEENPGLYSVDFKFDGYTPDEVRKAGTELSSFVEVGRYSRIVELVETETA